MNGQATPASYSRPTTCWLPPEREADLLTKGLCAGLGCLPLGCVASEDQNTIFRRGPEKPASSSRPENLELVQHIDKRQYAAPIAKHIASPIIVACLPTNVMGEQDEVGPEKPINQSAVLPNAVGKDYDFKAVFSCCSRREY